MDEWLGDLLDTVAGKKVLRERLTLVLTADHGGAGTGHVDPDRPEDYRIPFLAWGQDVAAGADLYELNEDYRDPGRRRPGYAAERQPVRNADVANLALDLLGLRSIPGSTIGEEQGLDLKEAGSFAHLQSGRRARARTVEGWEPRTKATSWPRP